MKAKVKYNLVHFSGTDNDCSDRGRNVHCINPCVTAAVNMTNCSYNTGHPPYTLSCCSQQRPPYTHHWRTRNNSYFYANKMDFRQHIHINSSQV